jgi:hypothetical protein
LRKWLVRGLVFSVLGGLLAAGFLYQRWTNPEAVRRQVVDKLHRLFPGAEIVLDSARLRLFGGIALNELRLCRCDDPSKTDFAYFPTATLYHDKEQLLDGQLAMRKVVLTRPRLRLVRGPDGRWNFSGIAAPLPADPRVPLPTLVVSQGILFVEDQLASPGDLPLEIADLNLTLVNDPAPLVAIEGTARCDLTGPVEVRGTWQRGSGALAVELEAGHIPVGPALVHRLGAYFAEVGTHARHLEGPARLHADLRYQPGSAQPWSHDVHWELSGGKLDHPALPLPVDHLEAAVRCRDGRLSVEKFSGRAGPAAVNLTHAEVVLAGGDFDFDAAGVVEHLLVNHELFRRLPPEQARLEDVFRPEGPATLRFALARRGGAWQEKHCTLRPEGMHSTVACFPYALDNIAGTLDIDLLRCHTDVRVVGYSRARPVTVEGHWTGLRDRADVDLKITADNIPLDEKLLAALPGPYQALARSFHPGGLGDIEAIVRHRPGEPRYANRYVLRVHDGILRWDDFPYPLEEVSGVLDIRPDFWQFYDFQGRRAGGKFAARGRSYPAPPPHPYPSPPQGERGRGEGEDVERRIALEIRGDNVALDKTLRGAIAKLEGLSRAWDTFDPAGRMNFTARIDRLPRQPQDLDVTVDVRGCTVMPAFFRYRLDDLGGRVHYDKTGVHLAGLSARHHKSMVRLPRGEVRLCPGGGLFVDLSDFQADPLVPDPEFLRALPQGLKTTCECLDVHDPLKVQTRLVVSLAGVPGSLPDIYWDGKLWLRDASLRVGLPVEHVAGCLGCVGRFNGTDLQGLSGNAILSKAVFCNQPFQDVHVKLDVYEKTPDVLVLGLRAPLFGGEVSGPVRVELNSTLRYEMDLTASQIKLEALGKHNIGNDAQFGGMAGGRLHLMGKGTGLDSLEGNGSLEIPSGRMYNLPLLLDLLKFLGLRWPDRTAFEQAQAVFSIHGDRVSFSQLELMGNAVSLHGRGDMNLDGSDVRLDFIPVWGRIETWLPKVWQPLPSTIGRNILKIEMRGKVGKQKDLHFHKRPVPGLTDPLLEMRDRIWGKAREQPAPKSPQDQAPAGR